MRYLSIAAVFCVISTALLLAEKKKTVKAPNAANEYAVKKDMKNHVEMTLKIKQKNVAGDPIMLQISVTNKGKRTVRHGHINFYRDFKIKVEEPSGKEVPFTRFGKQRIGKREELIDVFLFTTWRLAPGESYFVTLNLSLLFDLTLPGAYRLVVAKEIDSSKPTQFTLKVTGLEFKVSEPRPVIRARKPAKDTARGKNAPKK